MAPAISLMQQVLGGSMQRKPLLQLMSGLARDVIRFHKGMAVPVLNFTGLQSAGKTSLIEVLLGTPYGYKDITTASRCPVIISCNFNPQAKTPVVTLDGSPIEHEDLVIKMQEKMVQIKEAERFSEALVEVVFESDWVPDLTLIDHIGFITSCKQTDPTLIQQEQEDAEKIRRIAAKFIRDPNAVVVAVFNCPDGMDGFVDHLVVDEVMTSDKYDDLGPKRPGWQQDALIVVNKLNQKKSLFRDLKDVNAFLKSAREAPQDYHFVALKPDERQDPDRMEFQKRCEYFRNVPTLETTYFNEFRKEKSSHSYGVPWDSENDGILGVVPAFAKILVLWERAFRAKIPDVLKFLDAEAKRVRSEIAMLPDMDLFLPENIENVRSVLCEYALDFVHQMQKLNQADMVKDGAGNDVTNVDSSQGVHLFHPAILGKSFSDELDCFLRNVEVANTILAKVQAVGSKVGSQRPLQGNSSFRRVMEVFEYMFLESIKNSELASDDDIENADNLRAPRLVGVDEIAMQMAADQLGALSKEVDWLFCFLRKLYSANAPAVHKYLQSLSRYAALKHLAFFIPMLNRHFEEAVSELVQDAERHWYTLVNAKVGSRRHAGMIKGLLAFTALELTPTAQPVGSAAEMFKELMAVCQQYKGQIVLVDVVQDPVYRAAPQQRGSIDYDLVRQCARLQGMQMAVEIVSMFADILEARLVQPVSWDPMLAKRAVAVAGSVGHTQIEASVGPDPDEVDATRKALEADLGGLEDIIRRVRDVDAMDSKL